MGPVFSRSQGTLKLRLALLCQDWQGKGQGSLSCIDRWWLNQAKPSEKILLMDEILHQLIGSLYHYLHGLLHPRWCRIYSINSITVVKLDHFPKKRDVNFQYLKPSQQLLADCNHGNVKEPPATDPPQEIRPYRIL